MYRLCMYVPAGGARQKQELTRAIGLWLLKHAPVHSHVRIHLKALGETAVQMVDYKDVYTIRNSPSLPCANDIAWQGL